MSSFGSSTIPYLSMVPKPNYHIRQAYSPPINFNLLGEVVYDYGDLSVLVDLDEFAVNPVEPQGLVKHQPLSAEALLGECDRLLY